MADIFEEVEEGIRQDRMTKLWKKYSILAYIAAGLLLGGVALNEYLKGQKAEQMAANTAAFEAALDDFEAQNYEAAADGFQALVDADVAVSPAAAHMLAQVRLAGFGDAEAAAAVLKPVESSKDPAMAKLALLKAAYLKADTSTRADLEDLLSDLRKEDTAFGALAVELLAAKALEEGDIEYARTEFTYLGLAPNAPTGVLSRAEKVLATLPPRTVEAAPEADAPITNDTDNVPQETGE